MLLLLAGCGSDNPSAPAPVVPSPTPAPPPTPAAASSPYAGNWTYRATITAVDNNCGHTPADIGKTEAAVGVTIASNGTFTAPGGGQGAIDSTGTVSFTLAAVGGSCRTGSGAPEAAATTATATARPCRAAT
jgi:hypothetical protein